MTKSFWEKSTDEDQDDGLLEGYHHVFPKEIRKMSTLQLIDALKSEPPSTVKYTYLQHELQMRPVRLQNRTTIIAAILGAAMVVIGVLLERYII